MARVSVSLSFLLYVRQGFSSTTIRYRQQLRQSRNIGRHLSA